MDWAILVVAGIFECIWAITIKYTEGFTKLLPTGIFVVALFISMFLLSVSMKTIPIGTAYAVWTGIGAVSVAIIGMMFLGDPKSVARIVCISLIIFGVIGLKVFAHK